MDKIAKIKEIERLNKEMVFLIKKMTIIAMKPKPKYDKIALNRAFKLMDLMFAVRSIQIQIMTVKSQPCKPLVFPVGGIVVEPNYKEEIICQKKPLHNR